MTKRMLIDSAHEEETRVAIVDGNRLLEYEYESKFRKPLKGSIFLAKVTRVEPSLQAAFVNFGGNRHGFLPFSEIHPDYFRIPISDREALLAEQQEEMENMDQDENISEGAGEDQNGEAADNGSSENINDEDNGENIDDMMDDEDVVEEIGGGADVKPAPQEESGFEDSGFNESSNDDFSNNFSNDFSADGDIPEEGLAENNPEIPGDGMGDGTGDAIGDAIENKDESGEGENRHGRGGRGRRWRGGGRNGGRHGGRGRHGRGARMAYGPRQGEASGGDDFDDAAPTDRFRYNLRRRYKIQEVIKRGQIMLVQVSKEERGNKGAAVSTYLSLPGRYCVLMPNTPKAGGVSRKIDSFEDRARMREIVRDLAVPQGMSVIVRTAGVQKSPEEIQRDLDYLMRLWDEIRELTLKSTAPALVYGEADLIKRAVRDIYAGDVEEVVVQGHEGFETARTFMKLLAPTHEERVREYDDKERPLFHKYRVEEQIAAIGESHVTLPSGGYMIINQTEALVAIDVNSGKATRERHIEETALKTNLEAAQEVARQLRLRDLGGLIVIDFIDMEDRRNNAKVERRIRDSLSTDRARIQMGRISPFGLMELSRQRMNPSLTESQFEVCKHCNGFGRTRTCDATAIMVLRAVEDEGMRGRTGSIVTHVPNEVAQYIFNNKRKYMTDLEVRYGMTILIRVDDTLGASSYRIEGSNAPATAALPPLDDIPVNEDRDGDRGDRGFRRDRGGRDNERGNGRGRRGGRGGRDRDSGRGERGRDRNHSRPPREDGLTPVDGDTAPIADGLTPDQMDSESPDDNYWNRAEYHGGDRFAEGDGTAPQRRPRNNDRNDRGARGRGRNQDGRGRNNERGGRGRDRNRGPRQSRSDFARPDSPRTDNSPEQNSGFDTPPEQIRESYAPQPAVQAPPPVMRAPEPEPTPTPAAAPAPRRAATETPDNAHAKNFETVNEPPKEKKRGWWSKG